MEKAYHWDVEAGCYVMNTASGPRPHAPVIYHIPEIGDMSVDVSKRSPSGPYDVTFHDIDTGLPVGRTRTFATRADAIRHARG
jgi:hypothetical protein